MTTYPAAAVHAIANVFTAARTGHAWMDACTDAVSALENLEAGGWVIPGRRAPSPFTETLTVQRLRDELRHYEPRTKVVVHAGWDFGVVDVTEDINSHDVVLFADDDDHNDRLRESWERAEKAEAENKRLLAEALNEALTRVEAQKQLAVVQSIAERLDDGWEAVELDTVGGVVRWHWVDDPDEQCPECVPMTSEQAAWFEARRSTGTAEVTHG